MSLLRKQMTGYLGSHNRPQSIDVQNVGSGYDSSGDWQGQVDSFSSSFTTRAIIEPAGTERIQREIAQHETEPDKVAVVTRRAVETLEDSNEDISPRDRVRDPAGTIFEVVSVNKRSIDGWIVSLVEDEIG